MPSQRSRPRTSTGATAPTRPLIKTHRRSGVVRMISPPRAFSAGYGSLGGGAGCGGPSLTISAHSVLAANTSRFGRSALRTPLEKRPIRVIVPGAGGALAVRVAAPSPRRPRSAAYARPSVMEPKDIFEFLSGTGQTGFSVRHYFFKSCRGCRNPIQSFCRSTVRAARTAKCG